MSEVASLPSILERDGTHLDSFLRSVSAHPEQFVVPSKKLSGQAMKITKILFDHGTFYVADANLMPWKDVESSYGHFFGAFIFFTPVIVK